jgi:hypothetical protein
MDLLGMISNVHWIPVIVMTLFSFALGMLWHSSFLFGKTWANENNPNNIKIKINAPLIFGGTAFMHFLAISGLSMVVSGMGWRNGLTIGLLISIVWIVPSITGTYLFANRSLKLLAIDAGMYIVLFSVSGLVLGVW